MIGVYSAYSSWSGEYAGTHSCGHQMKITTNSAGGQRRRAGTTGRPDRLGPLVGRRAGDVPLAVLGQLDAVQRHAERGRVPPATSP